MKLQQQLARAFLEDHPQEAARALERMPADQRAAVVRELPAAARVLRRMVAAAAADVLSRLTPDEAASALEWLAIDSAIVLLRRLPPDTADRLIAALPAEKQASLRRVLRYPEDTAGALMDPAVVALPEDVTVGEARARLRRDAQSLLHYIFVVDRDGRLVGVLDIPELMRARAGVGLGSVMHSRVDRLPASTPAAGVRAHPGWRSFHALPVTDEDGRFLGAIRYQTLRRLEQEAAANRSAHAASITVNALGELFHIGVAGLVDGVAGAARPRTGQSSGRAAGERGETR